MTSAIFIVVSVTVVVVVIEDVADVVIFAADAASTNPTISKCRWLAGMTSPRRHTSLFALTVMLTLLRIISASGIY